MRIEEYRAWKGSDICGMSIKEVEKEFSVKVITTHSGIYDSTFKPAKQSKVDIGILLIVEGENENLDRLHRACIPKKEGGK